jgi:hypothetical protein
VCWKTHTKRTRARIPDFKDGLSKLEEYAALVAACCREIGSLDLRHSTHYFYITTTTTTTTSSSISHCPPAPFERTPARP